MYSLPFLTMRDIDFFILQTIIFLTQLQEYAETAGAMLLMHGKL